MGHTSTLHEKSATSEPKRMTPAFPTSEKLTNKENRMTRYNVYKGKASTGQERRYEELVYVPTCRPRCGAAMCSLSAESPTEMVRKYKLHLTTLTDYTDKLTARAV
jgi:hypothetical protein